VVSTRRTIESKQLKLEVRVANSSTIESMVSARLLALKSVDLAYSLWNRHKFIASAVSDD
jgi:hypothetical protein